jgi:hypothetical protein
MADALAYATQYSIAALGDASPPPPPPHTHTTPEILVITLIGFGNVNRAFARLVAASTKRLASQPRPLLVRYHAVVARHGYWEATPATFCRDAAAGEAAGDGVDGQSADASAAAMLTPAVVAALADDVEAGRARLDGTTPVPAGCTARPSPSVQDVRDIIARIPQGVRRRCGRLVVGGMPGQPGGYTAAGCLFCFVCSPAFTTRCFDFDEYLLLPSCCSLGHTRENYADGDDSDSADRPPL